jgi:hypothetical protein
MVRGLLDLDRLAGLYTYGFINGSTCDESRRALDLGRDGAANPYAERVRVFSD